MMRGCWIAVFLTALLLPGWSRADDLRVYLALRQRHGIERAVGIEALLAFVGKRHLEFEGRVTGSVVREGREALLLETPTGEPLIVHAEAPPEWLRGSGVRVRMMVRAERPTPEDHATVELLAAVPYADWTAHELEQIRARTLAELERERQQATRDTGSAVSRSSPPVRSGLTGPIGRGGPATPATSARDWHLPPSDATPHYAGYIKRRNPRLSDAQAYHIAQGIIGFSIRFGVDARLILAMVEVESGFNPDATSRSGAMGLGQLMPSTARGLGISNAYDTTENLYGTVRVIRGHLERYIAQTGQEYEGLVLALAAYNAGSGAVRRHGGVPPFRETQNYIPKVIRLYRQLSGLDG